ncbi:FMN-binding protein [Spirochaetota bacterium]
MKKRIYTVLFMVIITVVFISGVALIYLLTRESILTNESLLLKRSVLYAGGLYIGDEEDEIINVYAKNVEERENDMVHYYIITDPISDADEYGDLDVLSYVFHAKAPGLWGEIKALIGFNACFGAITGVDFIEQNETPGLGARISEKKFKEQFQGKMGPFTMVGEGEKDGNYEFDAITGATVTSTAVEHMLNYTITYVLPKVKKELTGTGESDGKN